MESIVSRGAIITFVMALLLTSVTPSTNLDRGVEMWTQLSKVPVRISQHLRRVLRFSTRTVLGLYDRIVDVSCDGTRLREGELAISGSE